MPHRTHEQTINTALGEILENLGQDWVIDSEDISGIFEDGGRPDILIRKIDGWPIVIEAEVNNHRQAEAEAQGRLGKRLASSAATIDTAVALVYPKQIRTHAGRELREALQTISFQFALFLLEGDTRITRFPITGWLSGDIISLALVLHRASVPSWRIEKLANTLETGITRSSGTLLSSHPIGSAVGLRLAEILDQKDDEAHQSRKMAMAVVVNALIFHEALTQANTLIPDSRPNGLRPIMSPSEFRQNGKFLPSPLRDEWAKILEVNYWPIFHSAGAILKALPIQTAVGVLDCLWETAEALVAGGVTKSHDLTGVIFQRLIADRKFLATFYTRPAAAALLSSLALPIFEPIRGNNWGDSNSLAELRIGDFACGTGTLLSTAYQRISRLHEVHQGDPKILHPIMMKRGLVGLDVLNIAVHLTATMLASSHPNTPFEGECLLTMPYGQHRYGPCVGSLDLLDNQVSFEIIQAAAHTAGGRGEEEVRDLLARVGHENFDLVIMNPPFTRHGAREGDRQQVHNPAFAAFETSEEDQNLLAAHLHRLARGGCAHGHAGLASFFVELAHRKLASAGTIALVLPLTSMSGSSWENVRQQIRTGYSSLIVVTISERGSHSRSFSADTGMAECLITAKKLPPADVEDRQAIFVVLTDQPKTAIEGELIAEVISSNLARGDIRKLEDGPFGGTRILIGTTHAGQMIDCALPLEGPWQMVGISDISLAQSAYQLGKGTLWIEGMGVAAITPIPITRIGNVISQFGPHHLDITGASIKSDGLPQGPFEKLDGVPPGAAYPCLWNHDKSRERRLIVKPDSHCQIRQIRGRVSSRLQERAQTRWATASFTHYNLDLQFNSQSIIVATTEQPTMGGRAWPTVMFDNSDFVPMFALWSNSTLGLVCHWWMSNKSQAGRGTTTPTTVVLFPTLDINKLSAPQLEIARNVFIDFAGERFLPFDQINEDTVRAELDRRLLIDILGLPANLCDGGGPMELLRKKLAAEPQIHANKKSRIVFTEEGEQSVPR
jgi:predicted RNA methylase